MKTNEDFKEVDKNITTSIMKEFRGKETEHICQTCKGTGRVSIIEDLGSGTCECTGKCIDCNGEGKITIEMDVLGKDEEVELLTILYPEMDKKTSDGFTEEQKKQIVNMALTTAGQILMSAVVLTNAENYITGDCLYPDGSKWILKFEKQKC